MAKSLPDEFPGIDLTEYGTGQPVNIEDFDAITEAHHYLFARMCGVRMAGQIFNPIATTTSTSYTNTNSTSGGRDLDTWWPGARLIRPANDSGTEKRLLALAIVGANVDYQIDVYTGSSSVTTITASVSGTTMALDTQTAFVTVASDDIQFEVQGFKRKASGDARLALVQAYAARLTAAQLPTGR